MRSRDVYVGLILFILGLAFFFVIVTLLFRGERQIENTQQMADSVYVDN
jgi:hypothetical protein